MMLHTVEVFHLELGKVIEGSTISIGGEEMKIISNLGSATLPHVPKPVYAQATQDATKFNECVSPELFAFMHMCFFDGDVRTQLRLPPPTKNKSLLLKVAVSTHCIQAFKRITLGEGVMMQSETKFNRPSWNENLNGRLNTQTQEWYEEIRPYLEPHGYVLSSCGMLMGVMNAASTTLGCAAVMHRMDPMSMKVVTLRSSDD